MSQTINVNGQSINYPETGDTNWGDEATDFAVQTSAALGKLGLASGTTVDIPSTLDVTGNTTLDANLSVGGNSNLGNSTSDTTAITGILNVDSGVLYVDPTNSRVGINDATPSVELDVNGAVAITGNETVGGTLGISNGTAAAPSLTFTSDTNTGLYRISEDKIGVSVGGSKVGEIGVGYGGFTGNIIQVQSTTKTDTFSSSGSASFEDITGLSVSITPRYSNSKILVNSLVLFGGNFWDNIARINLVRNGVNIMQPSGGTAPSSVFTRAYGVDSSNSANMGMPMCFTFLDSPNTTSIITYKIQGFISTNTWYINRIANNANTTGVSTITVMEVQQ